jgi:restriction system protein
MAIPDYQTLMLPVLRFSEDGNEHNIEDTIKYVSHMLQLTAQELEEVLPSGVQTIFANRIGWARTYLKKSGLLETTKRGFLRLTQRGKDVLKSNPDRIDVKYLMQFDEFIQFRARVKKEEGAENTQPELNETPEEAFERAYENLRTELADDVLKSLHSCSPSQFEKIVVELLVKMGYGGTLKDAGKSIGKSGDEGIDGIIKEDRLGLDAIYLQAKRWEVLSAVPKSKSSQALSRVSEPKKEFS